MRILVTGAFGFIGGHLATELQLADHHVIPVDHDHGDLRIPEVMTGLLVEHKPELVVHLAAKVGRLLGEVEPLRTVTDNAAMTALVAKACGETGVRLCYASTSEVYGNGGERAWREDELYDADPINLYGLSKRWGEEVCHLYCPDGLTILRLSMPYGPGHPPGHGRAAITNFLYSALNREQITVHRGAERSWCWIEDTVRGIRAIIESEQGGVWNVGRDDDPRPMREVAELACELTGAPPSLVEEVEPPERGQIIVKRLSSAKLRGLGWEPEVELEDGMQETCAWLLSLSVEAA